MLPVGKESGVSATTPPPADPPEILIRIPFEATPTFSLHAASNRDRMRMRDWLLAHEELDELAERAWHLAHPEHSPEKPA